MKITFNISEDFFIHYPELEISFKDLKKIHKKDTSKVLWSLLLDFHPSSQYKNIETFERRRLIEEDYLGFKLDWAEYKETQAALKKLFLTKPEQYLIGWEEKLDERQNFITSIAYSEDTFELLDKMMGVTEKLWKQYQVALKDVETEDSTLQGKSQESAGEAGII